MTILAASPFRCLIPAAVEVIKLPGAHEKVASIDSMGGHKMAGEQAVSGFGLSCIGLNSFCIPRLAG